MTQPNNNSSLTVGWGVVARAAIILTFAMVSAWAGWVTNTVIENDRRLTRIETALEKVDIIGSKIDHLIALQLQEGSTQQPKNAQPAGGR